MIETENNNILKRILEKLLHNAVMGAGSTLESFWIWRQRVSEKRTENSRQVETVSMEFFAISPENWFSSNLIC